MRRQTIMPTPPRLVVGLGNPGREYLATRHNAGWWYVDALAARLGVTLAREARFHGDVAKAGPDLRLAKPATYMNLSGRTVAALARFYAIEPAAILVVHDELDLPPGEVKLKFGGGVAGHNGLKDIRAQTGTADFWRLRLGIGHPRDSAVPQQDVADYVLQPPRPDERRSLEGALDRALDAWPDLAAGDYERAMLDLHTKAKP